MPPQSPEDDRRCDGHPDCDPSTDKHARAMRVVVLIAAHRLFLSQLSVPPDGLRARSRAARQERRIGGEGLGGDPDALGHGQVGGPGVGDLGDGPAAVSYTHLTLPTSDLV